MDIKAKDIIELLAVRHSKDIFVSECKTGPTWFNTSLQRLDAWAMKRSWVNLCMFGYEVKVSRADFVADNKWMGYLPFCNQFYFICPNKLIDKSEVPEQAGLIVTSTNATRLYVKKKAPHREIEPPTELLLYIIMSRMYVSDERETDMTEYWGHWLTEKQGKLELGTQCSKRLRESFREQVDQVRLKQHSLEYKLKEYAGLLNLCKRLSVDPDSWPAKELLQRHIGRINSILPEDFIDKCRKLSEDLGKLLEQVEKLKNVS